VNAKYCDKFAHVVWKDGRVMHVNVTKELYRTYKRQLDVVNDAILRRFVSHMRVHNVDEKNVLQKIKKKRLKNVKYFFGFYKTRHIVLSNGANCIHTYVYFSKRKW